MKEQYIISETVEHQIKVLQLLENLGYMWQSDLKPTELVPLAQNSTGKVIYLNLTRKKLSHSDVQYLNKELKFDKDMYQETTYKELTRPNKKVII